MYLNKLLALLALALPLTGWALSNDRDQPIQLDADRAQLNNATGVSVYTGNVVLTQGSLKITGDKMTAYQTEDGALDKVFVDGRPATYRQLRDGEPEPVRARAPRMEYYAGAEERVKLLQGGTLWQGKNEFEGETIVYDVRADEVKAASSAGEQERIRITFFPNQQQDGEPAQPDAAGADSGQ